MTYELVWKADAGVWRIHHYRPIEGLNETTDATHRAMILHGDEYIT